MGRKQVEALGYTFVEKDLPLIVKDWCIGDEILCLIEGEFPYSTVTAIEVGEYLKPIAIEKVMEGYRIYAGMIVVGTALD